MSKDSGKVNIHGKEYTTVAKRVQEFRETHKQELAIITEVIERTQDEVVMKATIQTIDGQVIATGYAEEKRSSSMINKTSALENCETSAIGRALANFGMAGTEYASADEVAQAIGQQSAPKKWTPSKTKPASDDQKMFVANLMRQHGIRVEEQKDYLAERWGIIGDFSQADAQMVIDDLNVKQPA